MALENGQGKHMKAIKAKNRAIIVKWEANNKGSMMDCSKATGISYACVRAHFAEMAEDQIKSESIEFDKKLREAMEAAK